MTWPELAQSPACRTPREGEEPAPPICLRVSKAPKQSKKTSFALKIVDLLEGDEVTNSHLGPDQCTD